MVKSTVVDNETGKSIDSTVRTSTGTFFGREVRALLTRTLCGRGMIEKLPSTRLHDCTLVSSSGPLRWSSQGPAFGLRGAACCVLCGAGRAHGPWMLS